MNTTYNKRKRRTSPGTFYQQRQPLFSVVTRSGQLVEIFKFEHSGKVVSRKKINTITQVDHPGIILGIDGNDRWWVAHNHYEHGRPMFELYSSFLKSENGFWDIREVYFDRDEIVRRAVAEVQKGRSYQSVRYNCQTFVNMVVRGENESEAVDRISDATMVVGALACLLGLATGNKTVTAVGAGVFATGGGAKLFSRLGE